MSESDVATALAFTVEMTGARYSEGAMELILEHLRRFRETDVLTALARCRTECRRSVLLVDILDRIDDGYPGPEAAWAIAKGATDEADTIVWTDEIAEAWGEVRHLAEDDRVAARMAFVEVYGKRLGRARAEGRRPRWWPSLGWDKSKRSAAIVDAVDAGRLPVGRAKGLLPAHEWPVAWLGPAETAITREGDAR